MTDPTTHSHSRDWYDITTSPELRQGDIFRRLLAFWLPQDLPVLESDPSENEPMAVRVRYARADWIVVSASCDVIRGNDVHVLLARVAEVNAETMRAPKAAELRDKIEVLRQGYDPWRFLLARTDDAIPPFPMSFVDYRQQVFLPLAYMLAHCSRPRLRLRPPFREKLGAWAGASLGRVGVEDASQIPKQSSFSASNVLKAVEGAPYP